MVGEVVHFEIPSDDLDRAQSFYRKTFGWKMRPVPDLDYAVVRTAQSGGDGVPKLPGAINGGLLRRQPDVRRPVVTIRVDDIDRVVRRIRKNGGDLLQARSPIGGGGVGFAAYFRDTEGNTVGLYEPRPLRPVLPRRRPHADSGADSVGTGVSRSGIRSAGWFAVAKSWR